MMRCICYKIPKCAPPKLYYDIIKYTITVTIYRTTTEGTVYDLRACVITTTEWEGLGTHEAGTGLKPSDLESDNCKRGQSKKKKKNDVPIVKFYCFWFYCIREIPRGLTADRRMRHTRGIYFFSFFFRFSRGGRTGTLLFVCSLIYLFICVRPIFIVTTSP